MDIDGFSRRLMPSRLELCFNKVSEGTELVMVHSEFPEEKADDAAEGWVEWYRDPLKEYFSKKPQVKEKT